MDESSIDRTAAARLAAQAESLMGVARYAEAVVLLQRAIQADPQALRPRCQLALALLNRGQRSQALRAADEAVLIDPTSEWPHRLRSIILCRMGKRRLGLAAAREAARLAPMLPEALYALASAELANGQTRPARQSAERLRMLAPDRAFSYQMLGLIALKERKFKEAEAHFRRAIELNPLTWQYMNNLGLALQGQGKKQEAIERFHDAARLDPTAETTRKNLARAVARYGSVSFLGIWIVLRFAAGLVESAQQAHSEVGVFLTVSLFALAVLGGFWWRRRRLSQLHPTVLAFYTDESRRERQRLVRSLPGAIALISGTLVTLVWSLTWLQQGAASVGLRSGWCVALYLLVSLPTIAVYAVWGWRRWEARRTRQ
jgi:tetratricopeptide (TPR) repeat protein